MWSFECVECVIVMLSGLVGMLEYLNNATILSWLERNEVSLLKSCLCFSGLTANIMMIDILAHKSVRIVLN